MLDKIFGFSPWRFALWLIARMRKVQNTMPAGSGVAKRISVMSLVIDYLSKYTRITSAEFEAGRPIIEDAINANKALIKWLRDVRK